MIRTPQQAIDAMAEAEMPEPWLDLIADGADMQVEELPEVVEIVEGLFPELSKVVIGSGSKSFKTWLTIHAALCISHGVPFLGRETQREPVLYVNLELKRDTFTRRVQAIARALRIQVARSWFRHLPLRGLIAGIPLSIIITRLIRIIQKEGFRVVVIDPVYKLNVDGEENSSRDMTRFFNELDRLTTEGNCTVIINDHFGKGNQSEKDPLDAIRGSSAKAGDLDAAMVLRKHEVDDCFRVDVIHRELAPVEPFVIGWDYPLMRLRPDLSPDAMKKAKGGRKKNHDPQELCAAIIESTVEEPVSVSAWAKAAGITRQTLQGYLPGLRAKGWIATAGEGNNARQYLTEKGKYAAQQWLGGDDE